MKTDRIVELAIAVTIVVWGLALSVGAILAVVWLARVALAGL